MFFKSITVYLGILLVFISFPGISNARTLIEEGIRRDSSSTLKALLPDRPLRPELRTSEFTETEIIVKLKGSNKPIRVENQERKNIRDFIQEYKNNEDVVYAEPNYIAYALYTPNDTYYPSQWNFDNVQYGGVHAQSAWDVTNGSNIVVAVIDTGVAYENYGSGIGAYYIAPDLAGTKFVQGYDFVNNDTHPNDDEGHGTHVAGTIAQTTNNTAGAAGLAYGASIMPLKVLDQNGSGTYADIVDAILFAADNGAKVINMSLGGSQSSIALQDAISYAHAKGVTLVAASGNNGANVVSYPAAYPEVISVGATRFDETRAPYSNYGSTLDIVAPGGDTSIDQNNDGNPDGILQQTFGTSRNAFSYYLYQGTSMATPHVAAAAALVLSSKVATTPAEVKSILESTADDLGAPGRDNTYGFGLLNVGKAVRGSTVVPPTDLPPTVSITSPSNAAVITGTVSITANAQDDLSVSSVDFLVDGVLLQSDATAPYAASFDTTTVVNGQHTLVAVARDAKPNMASTSIEVTVHNSVILPPSNTVLFSDGFENGIGLWTQDSQRDWFNSTQRYTKGSRSAEVDGSATNASLVTTINLQGKTAVTISYSGFIESGLDTGEYLAFDVSTNGGSSWQNLASLNGNQDAENVWHNKSHQLSGISSLQLRVRGKMNLSTEDSNIDDVLVVGSN